MLIKKKREGPNHKMRNEKKVTNDTTEIEKEKRRKKRNTESQEITTTYNYMPIKSSTLKKSKNYEKCTNSQI